MPTSTRRHYDTVRWRKASRLFLAANPLCMMCAKIGRDTIATIVHHKIAHNGNYDLFWSEDNWESVCASCHSGTARVEEHHGYSQAANVDGLPIDDKHPWNKVK